jgi:hypothetical protein
MDAFQERLARIALDAVGDRGFVLGGGHAVELHGMSVRSSEDIDLFSADLVAARQRSKPMWWQRSADTGSLSLLPVAHPILSR